MAAQVFLTSLAATTVLAHDYGPTELGTVDFVGAAGWLVGMLFEVVADHQKETWWASVPLQDSHCIRMAYLTGKRSWYRKRPGQRAFPMIYGPPSPPCKMHTVYI